MTTLQAIGFTLAGGSIVGVLSLGFFGLAVSQRSIFIAPRATARPRNVIYNRHPTDPTQQRGSPLFGWITWTLGLSYDTMLRGIPGTGTREGGLAGSMLKVNMDGIVLLRFHALGRRISLVASFLCITILLPLYFTAQCYGDADLNSSACLESSYNLTNYERTTMANIPTSSRQVLESGRAFVVARLYATAFSFWVLVAYILVALNVEWIQMLALRRVYYLEHDVWGERRNELKETLLFDDIRKERKKNQQNFTFESVTTPRKHSVSAEPHLVNRDPWIPHPEQRDTIPNVSLYSVLVGGLPSLPEEAIEDIDTEAAINMAKRQSIDWQLSVATTFFDHCVPNQPGFSSSIAAITILPAASDMTLAWRKWYAAASKLRRLRFIRHEIESRRHYDIQVEEDDDGDPDESKDRPAPIATRQRFDIQDRDESNEITPRPIYRALSQQKSYFRQVLGYDADDEFDEHVYEAMQFGPEQTAVYSREFAQAAAPCCPNGCREDRVRRASIDELLAMEREMAKEVHKANLELNEVRRCIAVATPEDDNIDVASTGNDSKDVSRRVQGVKSWDESRMRADLDLERGLLKRATTAGETKGPVSGTLRREDDPIAEPSPPTVLSPGKLDPSHFVLTDSTPLRPRNRSSNEWHQVEAIVADANTVARSRTKSGGTNSERTDSTENESSLPSGSWHLPSIQALRNQALAQINAIRKWVQTNSRDAVDSFSRDSTYAIVTFTSRQAAVAARNCLADGRGTERWSTARGIPIAPLADAAACDIMACRNCFRPVSVSINTRQKNGRKYCAIVLLVLIYIFYTIPLTFATTLVNAENLGTILPNLAQWATTLGFDLSGFLSGMIYTLFFSSCPIMFKAISNFGSGASSVAQAEFSALQYYWWFMVLSAFSGTLLATMAINGINKGLQFGAEFRSVLVQIANSIPTAISATWLNWIIYRFTLTLPLNYLLQFNTFLFYGLGIPCCARLEMGGGPGGPTPYRIFVDSGVVLMCVVALAPSSPLVSVGGLAYFLVFEPLLRRNLIYVYRPKFDGGGARWSFLFQMCISSIIVATILLVTQMALKQAIGPAIVSFLPAIPTLMYQAHARVKYQPAFDDAALLQTSLLDGWDTSVEKTSVDRREEFRRFLVDAHKASYVPVCIAGSDTNGFLTAEPAVVIPLEEEIQLDLRTPESLDRSPTGDVALDASLPELQVQHGATMRRAVHAIALIKKQRQSSASLSLSPSADTPIATQRSTESGPDIKHE